MQFMGQGLHQLAADMSMFPQKMINVKLSKDASASQVCSLPAVIESVENAEKKLAESGRVLLRASGTEPLIRVMVEGVDMTLVESCCQQISDVVAAQL